MTVMMSCDHHDVGGCVPDNRSRERMLEQLRAATALSDALAHLFHDARVGDSTGLAGRPPGRPVVVVDLGTTVPLMQAWLAWLQLAPTGDDWAPPVRPPAEIRVPDIDSEPATPE